MRSTTGVGIFAPLSGGQCSLVKSTCFHVSISPQCPGWPEEWFFHHQDQFTSMIYWSGIESLKAKSFMLINFIYVFHLLGGRIFPLQLINILNDPSTLAHFTQCTLHTCTLAHCTVYSQMFNCAKHKVPVSFSAALDSVTPGHNPRNWNILWSASSWTLYWIAVHMSALVHYCITLWLVHCWIMLWLVHYYIAL